MNHTLTVIIYEYPKAHGDVLSWAQTQKINEIIDRPESSEWNFVRPFADHNEQIICLPSDKLGLIEDLSAVNIDKLVLWGAFKKEFLRSLVIALDRGDMI